jgi:membrane-associated protease RseP (regulator of RpoE activity)
LERFGLGQLVVNRPVVHQFLEPGFGGKAEPDGMIGVEFLRRFKVFFDYGRSRMILEPNSRYVEPSRFDASGLRVHRVPNIADAVRIYQVLPDTPGAEAGLQETDLIVAVDDTPVQRMSPGLVQEALARDGRECRLLVQRGYEVFGVELKLRKLL